MVFQTIVQAVSQASLKPYFQVTNTCNTQSLEQFFVSSWPENNCDEIIPGSFIMIQKEVGNYSLTSFQVLETHWNVGKCWEPFLELHISPKMLKTVSEPSTISSVLQAPLLSCCLITTLRPWQNGQNRQLQREVGLAQPLPWQIKTESPRKILVYSFMDTFSFK